MCRDRQRGVLAIFTNNHSFNKGHYHLLLVMPSPILDSAHIWDDCVSRSGALNMAIDQILFEQHSETPILRFYIWKTPTISFGYFQSLKATQEYFPEKGLEFIRRWTGGGSVDHRIDLTYTLIIPSTHHLANLRGAQSYHTIHQAVANALTRSGVSCSLTDSSHSVKSDATPCFNRPVEYDIIDARGKKLAGAGQKRSKQGLLHQGSVIGILDSNMWKSEFIRQLTLSAITWSPEVSFDSEVSFEKAARELAIKRYASTAWTAKRP